MPRTSSTGLTPPATGKGEWLGTVYVKSKQALEAAGSMALQLLASLPATSGVDLATAMASLQQVQPAAALATLAAG